MGVPAGPCHDPALGVCSAGLLGLGWRPSVQQCVPTVRPASLASPAQCLPNLPGPHTDACPTPLVPRHPCTDTGQVGASTLVAGLELSVAARALSCGNAEGGQATHGVQLPVHFFRE